jgi:hypothetical protein
VQLETILSATTSLLAVAPMPWLSIALCCVVLWIACSAIPAIIYARFSFDLESMVEDACIRTKHAALVLGGLAFIAYIWFGLPESLVR